jgi:hypothetical protein
MPSLRDAMLTMTHDNPKLNTDFRVFLVYWSLHRVYDELDRPLRRHCRDSAASKRLTA